MLFRKCLLPTAWPLSFHMLNTVIVFILGIMLVILLCLGVGLIWGKQKLQCELDFGYINWNPNSQVACEMKWVGQCPVKPTRKIEMKMEWGSCDKDPISGVWKVKVHRKKHYVREKVIQELHKFFWPLPAFSMAEDGKNQTDISFRLNKTFCLTTGWVEPLTNSHYEINFGLNH